jgi:hypothetical protein
MATARKKRCVDLVLRLATIGFVLLAGAASCTPIASVNVSGGWSGLIVWTSGPMAPLQSSFSLDLFDDDGDVAGSVTLPGGGMNTFEIPVTRGEVHADTVVVEAQGTNDLTTPPTPVRFTFDGQASPTSMSGVGTQYVNGTSYTFTWQATLVAPPAAEP